MISPPTVTCVKFKGLACKVDLKIDTSWRRAGEPNRPLKKATEEMTQKEEPEPRVVNEPNTGKRRNPRRVATAPSVDYSDTPRRPTRKARPDTQSVSTRSGSDAVILLSISKEEQKEMALFLDVALRKLVGVKHAFPGVKVTGDTPSSPSLIDIAPGVWNLRYLQVCRGMGSSNTVTGARG